MLLFKYHHVNTWVALPSVGGMGETASSNIREQVNEEALCLQRRKRGD